MALERAQSLVEQVLAAATASGDEPDAVEEAALAPETSSGAGRSRRSRLGRMLFVGALVATAAGVARWLRGSHADNWQSSYVPTPPPARPDAAPAEAADEGGAEPGEAAADAITEPHAVTTPDEPAEVIEVAEPPEK